MKLDSKITFATDDDQSFFGVEKVLQTGGGDIVVVSKGRMGVAVYRRGLRVATFGGRGAGPGEFQSIQWIDRDKEVLHLYDFQLQRITELDLDKGSSKLTRLRRTGSTRLQPIAWIAVGDGMYLSVKLSPARLEGPTRAKRDSVFLELLDARTEASVARLGPFPATLRVTIGPEITRQGPVVALHPLGPRLFAVVWRGLVIVADGSSGRAQVFSPDGRRLREFELPAKGVPITESLLQREKARAMQTLQGASRVTMAPVMEALYSSRLAPSALPALGQILVQADGELLWIGEYRAAKELPTTYRAVSPTGVLVAQLSIPGGLEVHEIGSDYLLGVETDADGGEAVVKYRVVR